MSDYKIGWLFADLNAFFASIEQELRPELRGQPIGIVPIDAKTACCCELSGKGIRGEDGYSTRRSSDPLPSPDRRASTSAPLHRIPPHRRSYRALHSYSASHVVRRVRLSANGPRVQAREGSGDSVCNQVRATGRRAYSWLLHRACSESVTCESGRGYDEAGRSNDIHGRAYPRSRHHDYARTMCALAGADA